ncbi:hypothetical protein HYT33_00925 [Candidatus Roizmanbacteria bacterium]|nr:hypothetical protein [Candidatus Roizmanbacteria bacterium]
MSKKAVVAIIAVGLFVGFVIFYNVAVKKSNTDSKTGEELAEETVTPSKKLKSFLDPSGFKFSYPENVEISTKDVKDQTVYSQLEIVSADVDGSVEIEVKNSALKKIDGWFQANKVTVADKDIKKLKLGGVEARQFATGGKLLTIMLDQGVLFTITVDPQEEKSFWFEVNNKIVESFAFVPPETSGGGTSGSSEGSGGEDITFEGEEIIE